MNRYQIMRADSPHFVEWIADSQKQAREEAEKEGIAVAFVRLLQKDVLSFRGVIDRIARRERSK